MFFKNKPKQTGAIEIKLSPKNVLLPGEENKPPQQVEELSQNAEKPLQVSKAEKPLQLDEEEKVLWTGQPDPKHFGFTDGMMVILGLILVIPFSALLISFLVSKTGDLTGGLLLLIVALFCLFTLPFIGLGLYAVLYPYINYKQKKKTYFCITNKRAFVRGFWITKPVEYSIELRASTKTTILPGKNGYGSIVFDELTEKLKRQLTAMPPQQAYLLQNTLVFFDVADVDEVQKTIDSVVAENADETVRRWGQFDKISKRRVVPGLSTSLYQHGLQSLLGLVVIFLLALVPFCLTVGSESAPYGFADQSGKIAIKPQFTRAGNFSEGLAPVSRAFIHDWGYVDKSGKFAIQPKFVYAREFSEGLAVIAINEKSGETKYGYIDHAGNTVIAPAFDEANQFSGGLAPVMVRHFTKNGFDEKWGFIDKQGHWKVQPKFYSVGKFVDGIAPAYANTHDPSGLAQPCLIDTTGKIIVVLKKIGIDAGDPDKPIGFSNGLFLAADTANGDYGFINQQGKFVIKPQFENARSFSEGLAAVCSKGKWGYIDHSGAWVVKPQFRYAKEFIHGLAPVCSNGKWGYADRHGKLVIAPEYTDADSFSESHARVTTNAGERLIDKTGKIVLKAKSCAALHDGLAAVSQ